MNKRYLVNPNIHLLTMSSPDHNDKIVTIHNICPYALGKGPRAGQICGIVMINDTHEYCCTHRRAIKYRENYAERARIRYEKNVEKARSAMVAV